MNKAFARPLLGLSIAIAAMLLAATTLIILRGSTSVSHRATTELEQPGEAGEGEAGEAEGEEDPAGGDAWFAGQRIYPFRSLDIGSALRNARGQARALTAKQGLVAAPAWQLLGPSNIGG